MCFKVFKNTVLLLVLLTISCGNQVKHEVGSSKLEDVVDNDTSTALRQAKHDTLSMPNEDNKPIIVGANRTEKYLPLLKGKRVAVVANQTSVIFKDEKGKNIENRDQRTDKRLYAHLIDSLIQLKINIVTVFSPEHGFRGTADAGEKVKDGIDTKTGIPIISLYGENKKPKLERVKDTKQLEQDIEKGVSAIDIMVFDLQDVGARFYTYISTLHYVMEACAEAHIPLLILDRPNPNGNYIDGPILEKAHKSYVGMHPIPVVHGMTIGEYAQMINGEKWLKNGVQCELNIIPVENYTHQSTYSLPIKPSPNLPNDKAINLYPSLCFFEGTNMSVGRGTHKQFQVIGSPFFQIKEHVFNFTPEPNEGAKHPKLQGKICYGYDLSQHKNLNAINLSWLIEFYKTNKKLAPKKPFFTNFFTLLAGTKKLQKQIEAGLSEAEIKASWQNGLNAFKIVRRKYLLYE